ncbi:GlcNAc-transferase family protein [Achromobacter seleniivolatilans]|uniref:GlcNAc-transferase family protein n=1 Tax=Achromobacter seleniivolatilans TaxID=3047478 RepID=A0ABY9M107_9BURK|nr:GlcNAc-transferase family protein [Achromobacter sp. R39]WMD20254.1 GlcNAc-transferase family protein [Achromobacter sp. R39]
MTQSIFVQIASYRDPELIPTLHDLIERAQRPENLRVVVCWQHAPDEQIGMFFSNRFEQWQLQPQAPFTRHTFHYLGARIDLIDVPYEQSKGACWARNLIQQDYQDEAYTLQLDSHHRFVQHWDTQLIGMTEQLRAHSPKPLLTAYLPSYTPSEPGVDRSTPVRPHGMRFLRFIPEGAILFTGFPLPDWETLQAPVRARFYSGHFTFADGSFAREVRHDPDYFFHGEEISLAVRAFTHGYDLYHPHRCLAWHEYARKGRVKIWDDHNGAARDAGIVSEVWWARNERSLARNRALFGMDQGESHVPSPQDSEYGFGNVRSLEDYEAYAGICFRERAIQPEASAHIEPVAGAQKSDLAVWNSTLRRPHFLHIVVPKDSLDIVHCESVVQCRVRALRADGSVLHEEIEDIQAARARCRDDMYELRVEFLSDLGEAAASMYQVSLLDADAQVVTQFEKGVGA